MEKDTGLNMAIKQTGLDAAKAILPDYGTYLKQRSMPDNRLRRFASRVLHKEEATENISLSWATQILRMTMDENQLELQVNTEGLIRLKPANPKIWKGIPR